MRPCGNPADRGRRQDSGGRNGNDSLMATERSGPAPTVRISVENGAYDTHPAITVVALGGEHDLASVTDLSEAMAKAVAIDHADVAVDLSGVQYMGAATLGVILRTRRWLHNDARRLVVRSPSPIARRLLELCELNRLVERDGRPVGDHRHGGSPRESKGQPVTNTIADR